MKLKFLKLSKPVLVISAILNLTLFSWIAYSTPKTSILIKNLSSEKNTVQKKFVNSEKELNKLKNEDQYVVNKKLEGEIKDIKGSFGTLLSVYEKVLDQSSSKQAPEYQKMLAESLGFLSKWNYASANAELTLISKKLDEETKKAEAAFTIPQNVPVNNSPPSSGYQRQQVQTELGSFLVSIISADLNSTRVIVDTASDSSCGDNCPVLSLSDYVSRNGAYAGVNGSYFCPATYPSCQGKTNSFDTLLMNKNKVYFNSDNNVYSTVPAVIFGQGWIRFVGRSLDWGRDTGIDSMIANQPLVLSGGNVAFGGDGDPKKGSKGNRSFVGSKGNIVYIGIVYNATVAEVGYALKALDLENGLNLDSGGSTALWYEGYKAGPGRNIPNAILFVRK